MLNVRVETWLATGALLLALGALAPSAVQADVALVTDINVRGWPADSAGQVTLPQTLTTYLQGGKSRIDEPDGSILIFDSGADTVYQLDPKSNTFRSGSIKHLEDFKSQFTPDVQKRMTIHSSVAVSASTETAAYLGAPTIKNNVSGEARIILARPPEPHHEDNIVPGGLGSIVIFGMDDDSGGYHRGGRGGRAQRTKPLKFPQYDITGGIWESAATDEKHLSTISLALQMAWGADPFLADLIHQLDQTRQIPLHSEITVTQLYADDGRDSADTPPDQTITTTFDVHSMSTIPLSPSLFEIPAGYTKDTNPVFLPQLARQYNVADPTAPAAPQ